MGRRRRITILICALVCSLAVARPARAGSISDERELGKQFDLEARAQLPLIDDVEVTSYVDRIGQRIAANLNDSTFQYQFSVVRDPRINAFAVPGGYVYVHGGLLIRTANDDELAGVLGHEMAHVNAHHLARQQEAATLLGVLLSAVQPAIGAGAVAANAAVQLKYRREFEQEADYLGARYMRQAGYDPRGMLDFFKKMLDEQRATPTFAPPYLLSHPLTDTRLTNLEAVLRTHQWDSGPRQPASLELERAQVVVRARSEPAQDVVTYYRRQAEARPTDGRARYLLGLAQLETGAFDPARQSFEAARRRGFAAVDRDLGRVALRLQQLDQARELLSRATEIEPNDPVAHYELGKILEAQQDTAGALREYERAFQLAPTLADAHYGFGILAGRNGRAGDGYYHLAYAYKLRGEYDKALSQFEKAAPLFTAGTTRGQEVRGEIAELKEYLRHASGKSRRG
jgi:predicted Zn-dependent protease